jgi:hypothetical protein
MHITAEGISMLAPESLLALARESELHAQAVNSAMAINTEK